MTGSTSLGPLPLVIGVTGHRDLRPEDVAALESQVRRVLEGLRTAYRSTPLVLLSPLAEGADRLVARVALGLGIRLIAPLPLPRALYEGDFGPEGSPSRKEFAELLQRVEEIFELPLLDGRTAEDVAKPGPARDRQYAQVGGYIARHSQILLALWDGGARTMVGGTAHIVQFKLEGGDDLWGPRESPLDAPDGGPVYHIVTPRTSNPRPAGPPFSLVKYFPDGAGAAAETAYARIYARTEAFNRDALAWGGALGPQHAQSRRWLYPEAEAAALPRRLQTVRDAFATADTLALHFQARTFRVLRNIFLAVAVSALAFHLYAHVWQSPWVWGAYLAIVLGAWVGWFLTRTFQDKYQDYRALAEGLRVQFFWGLAGLDHSVATNYLRKQRNQLDWIRNAIRAWSLPQDERRGERDGGAAVRPARLRAVLRYWVEDQATYFARTAAREEAKRRRFRTWSRGCFMTFVGLGAVMFGATLVFDRAAAQPWAGGLRNWAFALAGPHCDKVLPAFMLKDVGDQCERVRHFVVLVIGMTAVVGALVHNFAEKRAFDQHAKQYARMGEIYGRAQRRLGSLIDAGDLPQAQRVVLELGQESLSENGDWVLLHRARPIEVPESEGIRGALPESLR